MRRFYINRMPCLLLIALVILFLTACTAKTYKVANAEDWDRVVNLIKSKGSKKSYRIHITDDFSIDGTDFSIDEDEISYTFGDVSELTVEIAGNKTISLLPESTGSLIIINNDQTVISKDIQWKGHEENENSLIVIKGTFVMQSGSISDNSAYSGGGVSIQEDGYFIMQNGSISKNTAKVGGGGGVWVSGNFEMHDGIISENSAEFSGGGVSVFEVGHFAMQGGIISGNHSSRRGGGVSLYGQFVFEYGTISDNSADYGGGVYVGSNLSTVNKGTLIMKGGSISNNSAGSDGGGVYLSNKCQFSMIDGIISNNSAGSEGGGVLADGQFLIQGGSILANSAESGGGIHIWSNGNCTMQNGTLTGNSAEFGGGVFVNGGAGMFTMEHGDISNNLVNRSGGGVYVSGRFFMKNGSILDNSAEVGGGVFIEGSSTFRFPPIAGGSVFENGLFVMENGSISNNLAEEGGGIYIYGSFIMDGGSICGNLADTYGGGICIDLYKNNKGKFRLSNGLIKDNSSDKGSSIYKEAGTIATYGRNGEGYILSTTRNPIIVVNGVLQRGN